MGAKSRENGKKGEAIGQALFRRNGYWVHLTGRSRSGSQPVDLVAIKGTNTETLAWLLDVKFVSIQKPSFGFEDIQPDQLTTLRYAREFANMEKLGFLIVFERDLENPRFLSYDDYLNISKKGRKSVNMDSLEYMEETLKCAER